jgi:hypothetical protein
MVNVGRFIGGRIKALMPLFFLALPNCTTKTEVYESQLAKEFKNGQTIFVKRTDELTRSYGALTGHLYGENHSFRFQFTIEPSEIEWTGLSGEAPKHILYCGDDLFLKTTMEQVNTDSVTQTITIVQIPGYYKNVDKRYFFKLFGEQYFVIADSLEYQSKKINCQEEHVPNM